VSFWRWRTGALAPLSHPSHLLASSLRVATCHPISPYMFSPKPRPPLPPPPAASNWRWHAAGWRNHPPPRTGSASPHHTQFATTRTPLSYCPAPLAISCHSLCTVPRTHSLFPGAVHNQSRPPCVSQHMVYWLDKYVKTSSLAPEPAGDAVDLSMPLHAPCIIAASGSGSGGSPPGSRPAGGCPPCLTRRAQAQLPAPNLTHP
jgi:hypothetical protein